MVEASLDEYSKDDEPVKDHMYIWFAKVLCFLRVCLNTPAGGIHGPKGAAIIEGLEICKRKFLELCFVFFFAFLCRKDLTIDQNDSALDCARLQWQ